MPKVRSHAGISHYHMSRSGVVLCWATDRKNYVLPTVGDRQRELFELLLEAVRFMGIVGIYRSDR